MKKFSKSPNKRQIYKLYTEFGPYIQDSDMTHDTLSRIVKLFKDFPLDTELIIDFKGVKLISPAVVFKLIDSFIEETKKTGKDFLRGRFLIVKDPNIDTLEVLNLCLKEKHTSLFVVYMDPENPKKITREDILNLPHFLREPLDIISLHGPITSREVAAFLGTEKAPSVKECLRQLYKRGLVKRKAIGTPDGKRFFLYEKFTLSPLSPST
jgi:hypothetical protein